MNIRVQVILFCLLPVLMQQANAQSRDSCRTRKAIYWGSLGVGSSLSMIGLGLLWYDDYHGSSFRWYNDNADWLQMDKAGHAMAGYYLADKVYQYGRWACLHNKSSLLVSAAVPMVYLGAIEYFDGHSEGWGASWGDLLADAAGIGLFAIQESSWKQQKIRMKWSFHRTSYAGHRPDLLGEGLIEEALKDYNGQTYWLSFNLASLRWVDAAPAWLNIAVGYSGDGMIGGENNTDWQLDVVSPYNPMRRRELFLSPDIDLSRIPVNNGWLKNTFELLSFIKVPLPTIGYTEGKGFGFYPLYF